MSILDRLFPRGMPSLQTRVTTGIKAYSETPGIMWARNESSAGVHVDEMEALTLSAVFAACNRMAGLKAMLPVGVYEKTDKGREERPTNSVSNLLNVQFNPAQTAFQARFFMQFWKPLFGSLCAEIGWDGAGRAARLWPIAPWRVEVEFDDDDDVPHFMVDGRRRVESADMLYVPHITEDGVTGKGFVDFAIESLGEGIAANQSAGRFFQNDMRPGGLLRHPGNPPQQARERFRNEWGQNHGGVKNRSKTGVLWGGWEWIAEAGAIDPAKAQLLESRQFTVIEVARWLNVPPHWLAEMGRATWSNIEHQSIETLTHVVMPLLVADEQEYDRKMLAPPRLYSKHNVNALLRGDMKTRGEFYRLMREIGAYDANDVRGLEDMNALPGDEGNKRFVPVNWQPAGDLMTGASASIEISKAKQPPAAPASPDATPADSPPAKAPAAPSAAKKPMVLQVEASRAAAEDCLTMLLQEEINQVSRWIRKPKEALASMDTFYPKHQEKLAKAMSPVLRLATVIGGGQIDPESAAAKWVDESRASILTAMECQPEEWPARSADMLKSWRDRPFACSSAIFMPIAEVVLDDSVSLLVEQAR